MLNKVLTTLGAAAVAAWSMAGAAHAQILAQPGETMGVALGAPLPEGVFFVDLESYGKRDNQANRLGVNIPIVAWSTPFSFYDTRLEVLYAAPLTHIDGPTANRTDSYSQGLLFVFAHDFGNGFNAAAVLGPRTPDNFTQAGRGVLADTRLALSYVKDGINASATFHYQGNFGGSNGGVGFRDNIFVDFTLSKKFNKLELGFVGTAFTDIGGPAFAPLPGAGVALGGLVGYDFGKFTLQGMVTREVARRNGGYGLGFGTPGAGKETRGWVRLIVPLYVAPTPAPVVARY